MPNTTTIDVTKLRKQLSDRLASTKEEMNRKGIKNDELMFLKGYERCLDNILFWLPPATATATK